MAFGSARMLDVVDRHLLLTSGSTGLSRLSPKVRTALQQVDRSAFVETDNPDAAYADSALPIGHGQTISQPFVVALMTELLKPGAQDKVLEIGTGSAYQAAILARLVAEVYTVETIPQLAEQARLRLIQQGMRNVYCLNGNGAQGWEAYAPYDKILITAAAESVPDRLMKQLAFGGRLIAPLGPAKAQQLVVYDKSSSGELSSREILAVRFVPFTGIG